MFEFILALIVVVIIFFLIITVLLPALGIHVALLSAAMVLA